MKDRTTQTLVIVSCAVFLQIAALLVCWGVMHASRQTARCEHLGDVLRVPAGWTPWDGCTVNVLGFEYKAW